MPGQRVRIEMLAEDIAYFRAQRSPFAPTSWGDRSR
jgi:hypothetical protein